MRKLLSIAAATAVALAGLAVLSPASTAQTQGARSVPLYLDNTEDVATSGNTVGKQTVKASIKPVNNCKPRNSLIGDGEYTLQPEGTIAANNDQIAGILDSHCHYEITYSDASGQCPVKVQFADADRNDVGSEISHQRPIAVNVDYNTGVITAEGRSAFVRIHFEIDRSDSDACGSVFTPRVDITIPTGTAYTSAAGKSVYEDAVIGVKFAPVASGSVGCEAVEAEMEVGTQGGVSWKPPVAGQAYAGPSLVHISRAEIQRSGTDIGCRYTATFTQEPAGTNLALQTAGLKTDVRSREGADTTSQVDRATARYEVKTVPLSVRATFPAGEEFTTKDKVAVEVTVGKPCGGTIAVIPDGLFTQSDRTSAQIFPEDLYLYGSQLDKISNTPGVYSVQAYGDPAGTQPCSVTASVSLTGEAKGRCSADVASRTDRYAAGADRIAFEFSFTCTEAASETEDSDASEVSGTDEPPAPPVIDLSPESSESAGPMPEGRTG